MGLVYFIIPELKDNELKFYPILQIKFELFTLFFSLSFSLHYFYLSSRSLVLPSALSQLLLRVLKELFTSDNFFCFFVLGSISIWLFLNIYASPLKFPSCCPPFPLDGYHINHSFFNILIWSFQHLL